MVRLRELNPIPRNLNLGYPTWICLPSWALKTVVPFSGGNQVVILHAFVGLRKTRYQSNNIRPRLEVISRVGELVALIHMNYICHVSLRPICSLKASTLPKTLNRLGAH